MVQEAVSSFDLKKGRAIKETRNGVAYFTEWKQRAIEIMLADDELMKLMLYSTVDWDDNPSPTEEERIDLIGKQIFQYSRIDTIAKEQKSYIGMGISNIALDEGFRRFSNEYISGYFYFHILSDIEIMDTNNGVRIDRILNRIYALFTNREGFGMGRMNPVTVYEKWVDNNTHGGYIIGFKVVELKS